MKIIKITDGKILNHDNNRKIIKVINKKVTENNNLINKNNIIIYHDNNIINDFPDKGLYYYLILKPDDYYDPFIIKQIKYLRYRKIEREISYEECKLLYESFIEKLKTIEDSSDEIHIKVKEFYNKKINRSREFSKWIDDVLEEGFKNDGVEKYLDLYS